MEEGRITGKRHGYSVLAMANNIDANKAGEIWAIALSSDGKHLTSTTYNGRINVWDLSTDRKQITSYETKGSYGMAIDIVRYSVA